MKLHISSCFVKNYYWCIFYFFFLLMFFSLTNYYHKKCEQVYVNGFSYYFFFIPTLIGLTVDGDWQRELSSVLRYKMYRTHEKSNGFNFAG